MSQKKVMVTLKKSPVGKRPEHRAVCRSLGLRKMGSKREHLLTPVVQGMINKVSFMIHVEEIK